MANSYQHTSDLTDEQQRVADQVADRLRKRGVFVHPRDSAEDVATLLEAVEAFEAAVEKNGGDLMVDEPPVGQSAEPDNPEFVLPERHNGESAMAFASRIEAMSAKLHA
jgi:broad specificity phosphatase PhoE